MVWMGLGKITVYRGVGVCGILRGVKEVIKSKKIVKGNKGP